MSCYERLKVMGEGVNKLVIFFIITLGSASRHLSRSWLPKSAHEIRESWHTDSNAVLEETIGRGQPVQPGPSAARTAPALCVGASRCFLSEMFLRSSPSTASSL